MLWEQGQKWSWDEILRSLLRDILMAERFIFLSQGSGAGRSFLGGKQVKIFCRGGRASEGQGVE